MDPHLDPEAWKTWMLIMGTAGALGMAVLVTYGAWELLRWIGRR